MAHPSHWSAWFARPWRVTRPGRVTLLAFALAALLGACELGLHQYQQAATDDCEPWRVGCPADLDFTAAAPISPPGADIDRIETVAVAADAPYRACNTVALVCQERTIGDVLHDQYLLVLAGRPKASAAAASTGPRVSAPQSPALTGPSAVPEPSAKGQIVRTQGTRAAETTPTTSALSR